MAKEFFEELQRYLNVGIAISATLITIKNPSVFHE
jgi:hypothetical protein